MSKLEKEIKILDIDIDKTKEKLKQIGATFVSEKQQKIYTYDLPSIDTRFNEIMKLLDTNNTLQITTSLKKLNIVLEEIEDLIDDDELNIIFRELGVENFNNLLLLDSKEIVSKINNSKTLLKEIKKLNINPNKWIRLRQSNDKTELTVKHIFSKNNEKIQKVKETEINVSDLEETNNILQQIGIVRRNYQEKIRTSYTYETAEIEIDQWPMIEPYMEIECEDEKVIKKLVDLLECKNKKIVSYNTNQVYKEKGIDLQAISELRF